MTVTFWGRPAGERHSSRRSARAPASHPARTRLRAGPASAPGRPIEWYATADDGSSTRTGPTWTFHTTASTDPVFVGAGDIASCADHGRHGHRQHRGRHRRRGLDDRRQRLRQRPGERVHELLRHHAVGQPRCQEPHAPGHRQPRLGRRQHRTASPVTTATSAPLRPMPTARATTATTSRQQLAHRQPRHRVRPRRRLQCGLGTGAVARQRPGGERQQERHRRVAPPALELRHHDDDRPSSRCGTTSTPRASTCSSMGTTTSTSARHR